MTLAGLLALGSSVVEADAPLGARTTYRVGGSARALVTLRDLAQVQAVAPELATCEIPVVAFGLGSNVLVNDGVNEVVAVVLGDGFATLEIHDGDANVAVDVGAAMSLPVTARRLAAEGVVGFEWAVGVPGSIGGAVAMNAGGHGDDMSGSLVSARVIREGEVRELSVEELDLGYRHSAITDGDIVLGATLRLSRGDADSASQRIKEIVRWRRENQPGGQNAGSVFRNPPGAHAGELIERAGVKGLRIGTARVSEKHANFIIADENGRAGDVFAVMREVRRRVAAETGVSLVIENRLVGFEEAP